MGERSICEVMMEKQETVLHLAKTQVNLLEKLIDTVNWPTSVTAWDRQLLISLVYLFFCEKHTIKPVRLLYLFNFLAFALRPLRGGKNNQQQKKAPAYMIYLSVKLNNTHVMSTPNTCIPCHQSCFMITRSSSWTAAFVSELYAPFSNNL